MTALTLPDPIAAYFAADKQNPESLARCFTAQAIVKDEGHTYSGLDAIKAWKAVASAKYTYTNEPFALEQKDTSSTAESPATSLAARSIFSITFASNAA